MLIQHVRLKREIDTLFYCTTDAVFEMLRCWFPIKSCHSQDHFLCMDKLRISNASFVDFSKLLLAQALHRHSELYQEMGHS